MIKGAIFDVDGTLLDSMCIWDDAGARYLKRLDIMPEPNLGNILFPMSIEEGAAYLKAHYHLTRSEEEIKKGVLDTVQYFYFYEAPLKEGSIEFLKALYKKNIPMVLATTSEREHIEAAFRRLHINSYFQKIFTCSEIGTSKRQPLIYHKALEYLGTRPGETYVFEDVLYAIQTAKNAGFRTVGIYDSSSYKDQEYIKKESDIYLRNLTEFHKFWNYASAE